MRILCLCFVLFVSSSYAVAQEKKVTALVLGDSVIRVERSRYVTRIRRSRIIRPLRAMSPLRTERKLRRRIREQAISKRVTRQQRRSCST